MNQLTDEERVKLITEKYKLIVDLRLVEKEIGDLILKKHDLSNQVRLVQDRLDGKS